MFQFTKDEIRQIIFEKYGKECKFEIWHKDYIHNGSGATTNYQTDTNVLFYGDVEMSEGTSITGLPIIEIFTLDGNRMMYHPAQTGNPVNESIHYGLVEKFNYVLNTHSAGDLLLALRGYKITLLD